MDTHTCMCAFENHATTVCASICRFKCGPHMGERRRHTNTHRLDSSTQAKRLRHQHLPGRVHATHCAYVRGDHASAIAFAACLAAASPRPFPHRYPPRASWLMQALRTCSTVIPSKCSQYVSSPLSSNHTFSSGLDNSLGLRVSGGEVSAHTCARADMTHLSQVRQPRTPALHWGHPPGDPRYWGHRGVRRQGGRQRQRREGHPPCDFHHHYHQHYHQHDASSSSEAW